MKKIISVLLCLVMLFSLSCVTVGAADELVVSVATDLHYSLTYSETPTVIQRNTLIEDYGHVGGSGQLSAESKAVIKAYLQKAAADESDVILLPGDVTDIGTIAEHNALVIMLKAFEAATGKSIYVVPGNHDLLETTTAEFASIYADFGYSEAIARDSLSASYVAELPGDYRLLAIDSCIPGAGPHGIDEARLAWISQQAQKAQADGKKLIAIMHHNLLEHFVLVNFINKGSIVSQSINLPEVFAQYGVKYTFSGHTHEHDLTSYTGSNGAVIYDAVTGALNAYPSPYRIVTFGDSVKFETRFVDSIDYSLVPGGMSETADALLKSDFSEYARQCYIVGMRIAAENYAKPWKFKNLLGINKDDNPEMCAIIDKVIPKLSEAMKMPLYIKDEAEEGKSIEAILKEGGITYPSSKYESVLDLGCDIYLAHICGDESYEAYSPQILLAQRGIAAMLMYALEDITAEEYAQVLTFFAGYLGVSLPESFISYAGDSLKRAEGIELFVSTVLLPIILEVSVDDEVDDNNLTLPGYAVLVEPEKELTFWEKLSEAFIRFFSFIMSLFNFIG